MRPRKVADRARTFWLAAFWLAVLAGVVVSLLPVSHLTDPWFAAADKVEHAVAYAVLFVLGRQAGYRLNRWLVCGLLLLGGAIEIAQGFTATRTAEWLDWAADALGIAVGYWSVRLSGQIQAGQPPWKR